MSGAVLSAEERRMARHALGLGVGSSRWGTYRNRYICGPGTVAGHIWLALCERGLAERHEMPNQPVNVLFCLTRTGAEAALNPGESLDPEDFPATPAAPGSER